MNWCYYIYYMEDFNFKLKDDDGKNKIYRKFIIFIMFFAILVFLIVALKINKNTKVSKNLNEYITLIKAENAEIKRKPENTGGMDIDNLDIGVYNVIDNQEKDVKELKVNEVSQNIEVKNNDIEIKSLSDSDLLLDKIEEIEENQNINATDNQDIDLKIKTPQKIDDKVNNFDELKQLGNHSLIKNIQNKKYIKPALKVQLLAVKNRTTIEEYWGNLKNNYQKLFNDKSYFIEKVDLNSENSVYRLQIGMFADEKAAEDFCQEYIKIANKTKIDCIIVK